MIDQQTNDKKKQKILKKLLKHFDEIHAAMPDAIITLNQNNCVEWFNKVALKMLFLNNKTDKGKHITECIDSSQFKKYFKKKDFSQSITISSPFVPDTFLNIRLIERSQKKWLVFVQDVTRMRQLEEVRRLFVSNVSHELRTPLTVLVGYLEILIQHEGSELDEFKPALELMEQQSRRMTHLLDDLLMLSNLEKSENRDENEQAVHITSMLEDIKKEAFILGGKKKHKIILQADQNLSLKGQYNELHSAFANLVSNAVRYTPKKGMITIKWQLKNDRACLSVIDNGIGIKKEHLDRLTERFYRIDKGRSRTTGGTGLGLAIVKHVLQLYDTQLIINSEFGKGSTFSCDFINDYIVYGVEDD